HLAFGPPPGADGIDGERRCVARGADADESTIARQVVDTVRHRAAERIVRIVMHVYGRWFASPSLAGVLEVAYEFLLFGVDAQDGQPSLFGIDAQRVVEFAQQPRE